MTKEQKIQTIQLKIQLYNQFINHKEKEIEKWTKLYWQALKEIWLNRKIKGSGCGYEKIDWKDNEILAKYGLLEKNCGSYTISYDLMQLDKQYRKILKSKY